MIITSDTRSLQVQFHMMDLAEKRVELLEIFDALRHENETIQVIYRMLSERSDIHEVVLDYIFETLINNIVLLESQQQFQAIKNFERLREEIETLQSREEEERAREIAVLSDPLSIGTPQSNAFIRTSQLI